jgi:alginate O-acetyltransferase complex protein AlgI
MTLRVVLMLFNSIDFLLFFPLVTVGYFALPQTWRWLWLLFASCYFYMVLIPIYILILVWTILIDYSAGILIETTVGRARRVWLAASIAANVGVLFFFKYVNFFNDSLSTVATALHWNYQLRTLAIILPVGLSFHTFQAMSYTIEVYRRNQRAERHLGLYALYVMFYPQLVAGPIERPQNLLPQLHTAHHFDADRVARGCLRMLWGFFKKVAVADRLAVMVNAIYNDPIAYTGFPIVLATLFFTFQIYCDFSGYSDIAIGSAEVMGIRLMANFDRPYFSQSIAEFWRRWHISLSTWFRDYVYIPLGGSRVRPSRRYANLFTVFVISGLWHGANWTFLIWGAIHGAYITTGSATQKFRRCALESLHVEANSRVVGGVRVAMTFTLVVIAWVFFRARTVGEGLYAMSQLLRWPGHFLQSCRNTGWLATIRALPLSIYAAGMPRRDVAIGVVGICLLLCAEWLKGRGFATWLFARPFWVRWPIYSAVLWWILLTQKSSSQFIYFQF